MPQYSIEARSLSVAGVAGHDFWVLRDENGRALAELHGLATDRQTGRPVPIGTDTDRYSLQVWEFAHDPKYAGAHGVNVTSESYISDGQANKTVLTADSKEVMARWDAAVAARQPLNALNLDYPSYGVNFFQDTVNSNSTYRTLGEVMGVPVQKFGGRIEPGFDHRMVSPEEISKLRQHGYPVLSAPKIELAPSHGEISPSGAGVSGPQHGLLTDPANPGNNLFRQAQTLMQELDAQHRRPSDQRTDNGAAALAVAAQQAGMTRIDLLEPHGDKFYAVQGIPGATSSKVAVAGIAQAMDTPLSQSSQAFHTAAAQQQQPSPQPELAQQQSAMAMAR